MAQKRNTFTLSKIKDAFSQLLIKKGLDALTVSDISRLSGINRGTFYHHFVDKYDLLEKIEDEMIKDLQAILTADPSVNSPNEPSLFSYAVIYQALAYVKQNFQLIQALVSPNGDPIFVERFRQVIALLLEERIKSCPSMWQHLSEIPADYAKEILVAEIMGVIQLWIRKDGKDSIEQVAHIISQIRHLSGNDLAKNMSNP